MRSDDKVSFIRLSKYTRLWLPAWYQVHIYSPLGVIFSPSIRLPSSMELVLEVQVLMSDSSTSDSFIA